MPGGKWLFALCVTLVLCACAPATRPTLPTLHYATAAQRNPCLLVILRGIGGDYHDFERLGAIRAVTQRQLPFDVVVPDAHFGYYRERNLIERLHTDIIAPARQQGYRQIWLAGFSMGGLGSLLYVRERPQDIDGVLLISPFLGWDGIIHEIKRAGGLATWQPGPYDAADWQPMIWDWIRGLGQQPDRAPPIYLGYATDDGVADEGPPLLATALPEDRVFSVPGRHVDCVMMRIFTRHLDQFGERMRNDATRSLNP